MFTVQHKSELEKKPKSEGIMSIFCNSCSGDQYETRAYHKPLKKPKGFQWTSDLITHFSQVDKLRKPIYPAANKSNFANHNQVSKSPKLTAYEEQARYDYIS